MKHPNKDVNKAVQHAREKGWTIKAASGHAWAIIRCPKNKPECRCGMFCQISV
jgi:biotin operon repressor